MKRVIWKKTFRKDYKKLTQREREAWTGAIALLEQAPYHKSLRRHKLSGRYQGLESIDVLPDLRAVFFENNDFWIFHYIRNHGQLYD